jgi:hypothetical protein
MAKCVRCGTETILHNNGLPVCLECDDVTEAPIAAHSRRKETDKQANPSAIQQTSAS